MKKNTISVLVFLGFIFTLFALPLIVMDSQVQEVVAADEDDDDVDGVIESQNFNNRAELTGFQLKTVSGGSLTVVPSFGSLDPQQEYRVEIEVSDPDTIRDLDRLEVRFYNAPISGNALTSVTPGQVTTEFNNATRVGLDGQEFVVQWDADDDDNTVDDFAVITSESAFTWTLTSISTPGIDDMNRTSFTFIFDFTISKVAPETPEGAAWYFGAIIEDGKESLVSNTNEEPVTLAALTESSERAFNTTGSSSWRMNWYGEINVSDSSIRWDDLPAGVTFGAAKANTTINGISLIANGIYDTQIRNKTPHWDAIMTEDLAKVVFQGFTSTDFGNFITEYNQSASALINTFNYTKIPSSIPAGNTTFAALDGLPYEVINIVKDQIGGTNNWTNFDGAPFPDIELPDALTSVNLTGANIVVTSSDFDAMFGTTVDLAEYQKFAIGYVSTSAIDQNTVEATSVGYYLVPTSATRAGDQTGFASFQDEAGDIKHIKTTESGHEGDFELYIALSRIFQNARYEGILQLKITNPAGS